MLVVEASRRLSFSIGLCEFNTWAWVTLKSAVSNSKMTMKKRLILLLSIIFSLSTPSIVDEFFFPFFLLFVICSCSGKKASKREWNEKKRSNLCRTPYQLISHRFTDIVVSLNYSIFICIFKLIEWTRHKQRNVIVAR